jgi:general stress protein 26
MTNRWCLTVRVIERTGRMTLLYQHDADRSYVALVGRAQVVEDVELKRSIWQPGHDRWNPGGPEDPATVFARLVPDRIELWSAVHDVMPEPQGYSAAILLREAGGWRYATT